MNKCALLAGVGDCELPSISTVQYAVRDSLSLCWVRPQEGERGVSAAEKCLA